ncbi:triose-phosphate isomerase [Azoarcus taiwanensis]|uniref:Triosephosphate isomerase n=1 Tax=Azoarcus taiwanensis TaxID=666964 RepID=A0A972F8Y9_9RHOO|nr:triose-phosphate isomerase [Azoarcus taiwanensis]NMG04414.1 triose-phosphate isomerase [Azoarcus taiwanensis]
MKSSLVIGNWKSNGSLSGNRVLLDAVASGVPAGVRCAVCVPYPYLAQVGEILEDSAIAFGSQDVSEYGYGAYTGEVNAEMLAEFGCRFVIVGHSERRSLFDESDETVARKAGAVLDANMVPVVCVGETLAQRDAGEVHSVLQQQLDALDTVRGASRLAGLVVAYEPVWAIGTGRTPTPEQVQDALGFVRAWFAARIDDADAVDVLYGGSVKAGNAAELFALPDSDGGLIGGASLVADEFVAICAAAVSKS